MFSLASVSSPSAVSTKGTLVEAKNGGSTKDTYTVNGVTFSPGGHPLGTQFTGANPGKVIGDAEFDALLNTASYAGPGKTGFLEVNGLISGHNYEIQLFMADNRSCCNTRVTTVSSGGSSQRTGAIGTPQLVTAKFTAISPSIKFSFSGSPTYTGYLNAWQVRDLDGGGKKTVTLPATAVWFDTGVDVPYGYEAKLMINATGEWSNGGPYPQQVGPNGFGGDPVSGSVLETASFASLIGRIGENGAPFFVGESFEEKVSDTGRLFLQMNDTVGGQSDNEGQLEVSIEVE